MQHDDAIIREAQQWLHERSYEANPVEKILNQSGLNTRTFNRRFLKAASHSPIHHVQRLRIDKARQLLEVSNTSTETIGLTVGYEDPTSFRRLFKRLTNMTPKVYRRRFQIL